MYLEDYSAQNKSFYGRGSILLAIFLVLCLWVIFFPVNSIDTAVSKACQKINSDELLPPMKIISMIGKPIIFLPLSLITTLVLYKNRMGRNAFGAFMMMGVHLPVFLFKELISRQRPSPVFVEVHEISAGGSFPSGTVAFAVVFFGFLGMIICKNCNLIRKISIISLITLSIITIAFSRLYLGAHWFSDTVGGLFIGSSYLLWLTKFS